jgi:hypothetical protein
MVFVKVSRTLHTRLVAATHTADGELLQVAVNREEFLKLQERTRVPVLSKRDRQHFKLQ